MHASCLVSHCPVILSQELQQIHHKVQIALSQGTLHWQICLLCQQQDCMQPSCHCHKGCTTGTVRCWLDNKEPIEANNSLYKEAEAELNVNHKAPSNLLVPDAPLPGTQRGIGIGWHAFMSKPHGAILALQRQKCKPCHTQVRRCCA